MVTRNIKMSHWELDDNNDYFFKIPTFTSPKEQSDAGSDSRELDSQHQNEMSIVPGMSVAELLEAHRQVLLSLNADSNKSGDRELHSLTLSRRHLLRPNMYESMVIDGVLESLTSFSFGVSEDG
ncbi:hypothetical protein TcYC6_0053410 [Trypanosoma cruzi]|nr:hypothetical protein TcYC6_0053410 [Trypanosoma cruzi]